MGTILPGHGGCSTASTPSSSSCPPPTTSCGCLELQLIAVTTVSLVGSTGSIGTQALDVVRAEPGRYEVVALGAASSVDRLAEQAQALRPEAGGHRRRRPRRPSSRRACPPGTEVLGRARGARRHRPRRRRRAQRASSASPACRVTLAALEAGAPARAGQQGVADRRRARSCSGPGPRRAPRSCRSTPSTAPSTSACGAGAAGVERVRRIVLTASGGPFRGRTRAPTWPTSPSTTRCPSDVADGPEDHRRLVHADEQGPRGHRGPRAVRRRLRPHRGGRAPAVGRPLDGRVHRRRHHRPALACPTCACRSATPSAYPDRATTPFGRIDWATLAPARLRAARPRRRSRAWPSPTRRAGPGGTARPGSTPPTRWRWPPSSTGVIPWPAIADVLQEALDGPRWNKPDQCRRVIEADRRARESARRAVERRAAAA